MGTLLQDVKFGIRMLAKNRWFTLIAVLTLALGIGVNTAVFSVVNGVLLNPLPFPQPKQLVAMFENTPDFKQSSISYPNFLDWQRSSRAFSSMAAYREDDFNLTGSGEAQHVKADMVSADFFPLLGVRPVLGRTFTADEDRLGAAPVAMISAAFWNGKFGSSAGICGTRITMNGKGYTIIGVVPSTFHLSLQNFHDDADVYVPVGIFDDPFFHNRDVHEGMDAVARLKPGVTVEQARADMDGIARNLAIEYPDADKKRGITIVPLKEEEVAASRLFLLVLLGAVGFVLLIGCVNVANLQLARSTSRAREFAIRTALGATQGRVIRQLLTESIVLAAAGGGLGLLLADWGTRAALGALPEALPRAEGVGVDGRVLIFTIGVSILCGIVFGLAPALKTARPNVQETLKESGRGGSGAKHRALGVFVVVEMAMALILLVGAGLMVRSLIDLWNVNPGFNPKNVLTFAVSLSPSLGVNGPTRIAAYRELERRIQDVPGVEAVSLSGGALPMQGDNELPFWLEGQPKPANTSDMKLSLFYFADQGYRKAMGIHLERGRFLEASDDENSPKVVVIDDQFARQYFPNEDPIGKHINLGIIDMQLEVVGIVGHVKHWGLDKDSHNLIQAQAYMPLLQIPDKFFFGPAQAEVVVRTEGSPAAMTPAIRKAVEEMNGDNVMYDAETMEQTISDSLAARRFSMILLGVFAALALALSSIGIFGVISYVVGQRTHEIGIRIALGAQRSDVLRLMLGEGMKMTLIGVAIGVGVALGVTRLMENMLFGVSATDPVTFAGVALILTGVALLACYFPARRAMRVDPMVALRYE
ncbi:MAG TPA: ABC transporter permease [Verrucomicrobiae bacterium]|nr:ABC transporter permease [Verrucomicrobiae bacterium]